MDRTLNFSIEDYLTDSDIPFEAEGKNISAGWIGTKCLFCNDPSNHFGINLEGKFFNCWRCGASGSLYSLIKEIEGNPSRQVIYEIIEKFQVPFLHRERKTPAPKTHLVKLPLLADNWPDLHIQFLKSRKHNPDSTIKKYDLKPSHSSAQIPWSIIVPFYLNSVLVTYVAIRLIREEGKPKYVNCPEKNSIITTKQTLYNIDSVKQGDSMLITEGILDVWRLGENAVGLMGKKITNAQFNMILEKDPRKVIIILDSDARKETEDLGNRLSSHGIIPVAVLLKKGDADNLNGEELRYIDFLKDS